MKTQTRLTPWKLVVFCGICLLVLMTISISLQLELPQPTGPYAVGRTIFRWVDISRPEVMTADMQDAREVMAFVWYPAIEESGRTAGYVPDMASVADTLSQSGELTWWEVLGIQWVRSTSPLDAQPLGEHGPYPVVLLFPGNATNIEFYSNLAGELASHGYIVVGVNHPYDVPAVELSNGNIAPYDKDQWSMDLVAHQTYIAGRHKVKVGDALFVMDQLESLNQDANNLFAGLLDLDSVAAAGHSLGGIVASDVCKADARFKACINFDGLQRGGPFSMDETALAPEQPFLFLTKETQLHRDLIKSFEATPQLYWVTLYGASHDSFTDGPVLQPTFLPIPNRADRYMTLIEKYTLAFLDKALKGRPDNLLSQSIEQDDVSVRIFSAK